MQNFENVEDLVSYMFEKIDNDSNLVSVIANKEITVEIMAEILNYNNVILNTCEIDYDYGKEYMISLFDDVDSDNWYLNIVQCYSNHTKRYMSTEGYVLFHENVNSKALIDMQNNSLMPLGNHDWFVIGEAEKTNDTDENDVSSVNDKVVKTSDEVFTSTVYKVNGKNTTKEEFEKAYNDLEDRYLDNMKDMLIRYASFMDDWNDLLRLLF